MSERINYEAMLRTLGKTGRWESDFEAEEAVDWAVGELARLRAELARASEKEASARVYAETHLAARVKAERERDAVSRKLAEVLVEPEHRRHFLCSYLWYGGGRSGSGMIGCDFAGPMTMETITNVAECVEADQLRKNGVPVVVVVMGMVELEGGGE